MTPVALEAFLHEYRIAFPVGVDRPGTRGPIPQTMEAYVMRGTPTLVLIDASGRIRHQHFGQVSDLVLGAQIADLVHEAQSSTQASMQARDTVLGCGPEGCALPA